MATSIPLAIPNGLVKKSVILGREATIITMTQMALQNKNSYLVIDFSLILSTERLKANKAKIMIKI